MLVLIPQLRWVASELNAAMGSDDRDMTRRHLDSWRWQAGHVNGLLTPAPRAILKSRSKTRRSSVHMRGSARKAVESPTGISAVTGSCDGADQVLLRMQQCGVVCAGRRDAGTHQSA